MLVTSIGGIEVGIGEPILKSECLGSELKLLLAALKDYIHVGIGVGFPALALVGPSKHSATLLITASGHKVAKLLVGILRELGKIAKTVECKLVTCLYTAQVKTGIVHRLIYETSLAGALTLHQCGKNTDGQVHTGV